MMTPLIDSLYQMLGYGAQPTTANGSPYGVTDSPATGGAGVPGPPGSPSGPAAASTNPMAGIAQFMAKNVPGGAPGPPSGPAASGAPVGGDIETQESVSPPGGQPGMPGMGTPPMGAAGVPGAAGTPAGPADSANALADTTARRALKAILAMFTSAPGAPGQATLAQGQPSQPQGWDATVTPASGVTPNAGPAAPGGPPGAGPGALAQILGGVASGVPGAVSAAVPNGQAVTTAAGAASPILAAIKSAISSPQAAATPNVPPSAVGAQLPPGVPPPPPTPGGVGPTLGASPAVAGVTPVNMGGPMGPNNPAVPGFQPPHPVVTRLQEAMRKIAPDGQLPVTPAVSTPGTKSGQQGITGDDVSSMIRNIALGAAVPGNSKGARFLQGAHGEAQAEVAQKAAEAKAGQQKFANSLAANKDKRADQAETRQQGLSDARIANYVSQIAKRSDTTLTGAGKASIQRALTNEANNWQARGKTNAQIDKHINAVSKWMTGDGPYPAEGVDNQDLKSMQQNQGQAPNSSAPAAKPQSSNGKVPQSQEGEIRSNANGDRVQLQGGQWVPLPAAGQ